MSVPSFVNQKRYRVELQVVDYLLGALPAEPDALKDFVEGKRQREEVSEEELPEERVSQKRVFRRRNGKCCLDEHVIRAIFREAFTKLKLTRRGGGPAAGLADRIYCEPPVFELQYDDVKEEIRPLQVRFRFGAEGIVCIHEALEKPSMAFDLIILEPPAKVAGEEIDEFLRKILEFAGRYIGMGAGRLKSGKDHRYGFFEVKTFQLKDEA